MLGYIHNIIVQYSSLLSYLKYYKRNVIYAEHYSKYCQVAYETGNIKWYNWRTSISYNSFILNINGNKTGYRCSPNYIL